MTLKDNSVNINGIRPELLFAIMVCDKAYTANGKEMVITSINDGHHSTTSLHYNGCAFDLRTYYFDEPTLKNVIQEIKSSLSVDFDVVNESDHLHIEYQPRRKD